MSEQHLDDSDIDFLLEQVGGKAVAKRVGRAPVPIENSDSTILMMQSAKNRVGGNAAVKLNCTRDRSILVQR